jgi:hypothetical protein
MLNRRLVAALGVITAIAALNVLAACTPSDDNDIFATPTLPPEPTPVPVPHCQIVWANLESPTSNSVDLFVVDGAQEEFINGGSDDAGGAGTSFLREYFAGVDLVALSANHTLETRLDKGAAPTAVITTGSFSLTIGLNGTNPGADLTYTDATNDAMFGLNTAGTAVDTTLTMGSGGAGSFSGTISGGEPPDIFTGNTVNVNGMALGADGSWATCYQQAQ